MAHKVEKFEIPERIRSNSSLIPSGVINAYVYDRLTDDQRIKVKQAIEESKDLQKLVEMKELERLQLKRKIPNVHLLINPRKSLTAELATITDEAFPPKKETIWEKIGNFLDKTIFEI